MSVPDKLVSKAKGILRSSGILFIDYDGTLVPIRKNPEDCYPDDELASLLEKLNASHPMFIVTGRSLEDIVGFIGRDYNIIALHGAVKMEDGEIEDMAPHLNLYREICNRVFNNKELFEKQFEGLRMYNKNGNLLFHLGYVRDPETGEKIRNVVDRLAAENQMEVYEGKDILELRPPEINKGIAIKKIRKGSKAIIAGDDITDEESFIENPDALRIKVGEGDTAADFRLDDTDDMREFLRKL